MIFPKKKVKKDDVMIEFWKKYLQSNTLERQQLLMQTSILSDFHPLQIQKFPAGKIRDHYIAARVQNYIDDLIMVLKKRK